MSVCVTSDKKNLKKQHARRPNFRTAPEPRQNKFAHQKLYLEKQKRPQKHRRSIDSSHRLPFGHRTWRLIITATFHQKRYSHKEIKNLFDRKNVLDGYTRTGSATNPGTASYQTRSSTYWDSRNNNNFALRRTIYMGLEFIFGE